MKSDEFKQSVKRIVEELFGSMGYEANVETREPRAGMKDEFICDISVARADSRVLIGSRGANLSALSHILQLIAKRRLDEFKHFSIDINRYWAEKMSVLERDAADAARQVIATGRPVSMRPMLPAERKLVHTILATNERVETESAGSGENRKVVVKPASII